MSTEVVEFMKRVKVIIACMVILVLLVLSQAAWAQNQAKNQTEKVATLEELQTRMKVEQADLLAKDVNFDKAGSNVTNVHK